MQGQGYGPCARGAWQGSPGASGPGCDREGTNAFTLDAEPALKSKVPTHPVRSCPEPGGHPALFRAGCQGGHRAVRVSLRLPPRPTHPGGTSRPAEAGSGAESLAVTRPPRLGRSPAMSLYRSAALTREGPRPRWLRRRPGTTVEGSAGQDPGLQWTLPSRVTLRFRRVPATELSTPASARIH